MAMGKETPGQLASLRQISALGNLPVSEAGFNDCLKSAFSAMQDEVAVHLAWLFLVDVKTHKLSDESVQIWGGNPPELETGPLFLEAGLFPSVSDLLKQPCFAVRGEKIWSKKKFEASALYQGVLKPEKLSYAFVSLLVDDEKQCRGYSIFWRSEVQGSFSEQDCNALSLFLPATASLLRRRDLKRVEPMKSKTKKPTTSADASRSRLFEPIEKVSGISEEELYSLIRRRAQPGVLVLDQDGKIVSLNGDARAFLSGLSLKNNPVRTIFENETHGLEAEAGSPEKGLSSKGQEGDSPRYPEIIHQLYLHFVSSIQKRKGLSRASTPTINRVCIQGEVVYLLRALLLEEWRGSSESFHFIILVERVSQGLRVDQIDWDTKLTPRENEVVKSLLEGKTNKEVAVRIEIGEYTVKDHIKRIMKKLGVTTRAGIVAKVLQHHFPA